LLDKGGMATPFRSQEGRHRDARKGGRDTPEGTNQSTFLKVSTDPPPEADGSGLDSGPRPSVSPSAPEGALPSGKEATQEQRACCAFALRNGLRCGTHQLGYGVAAQ
jgi:hypothetical protein